jgi:hypothetical protein
MIIQAASLLVSLISGGGVPSPPLLLSRSGVPACQRLHPYDDDGLTRDELGGAFVGTSSPQPDDPTSSRSHQLAGSRRWSSNAFCFDGQHAHTATRLAPSARSVGIATHLLLSLPQRLPLSTRLARAPPSTLPNLAATRVRLVWQHPPFHDFCSFSRPQSSFPSGDDRASCAARCSSSDERFVGDKHPTGVCLPIPLLSHPAARNQTSKPLTHGICIRI